MFDLHESSWSVGFISIPNLSQTISVCTQTCMHNFYVPNMICCMLINNRSTHVNYFTIWLPHLVPSPASSISVDSILQIPYCVITTARRLVLIFFSFLVYKATMTAKESGTSSSNAIENTVMPVTTPIRTPDCKVFAFTNSVISLVDRWTVTVVGSAPAWR